MDEFGKLVPYHKITLVFIRLRVTVSNRLNALQSEIFTEFRLKSSTKPTLKLFAVSLEISSDPKYYFRFTFDEFTELTCMPGI